MRTTIDAAGRIVVPKAVRSAAGIGAHTEVDVRAVEGRIEIEPLPVPVALERRKGLLVAVPKAPRKTLRASEVEATREALLSERGGGRPRGGR